MSARPRGLTYRAAGVDVDAAEHFVQGILKIARRTHSSAVVRKPGTYAGLMRLPFGKGQLLAASCDGVGTKVLVARDVGKYDGLGFDLVAMQVNDLLPAGARPMLFLDYLACGRLQPKVFTAVVASIAKACKEAGCVLLGGETAEMPGVYAEKDFDLAGFSVGLVEEKNVPDVESMRPGDVVLGLPSSGLHSNGYSLARKALLERGGLSLGKRYGALKKSLGETLLTPTRIYVRPVLDLMAAHRVKACAHITGGGLLLRGKQMARPGRRLVIDPKTYTRPAIVDLVGEVGAVADGELARTFNMGLGFLTVVSPATAKALRRDRRSPWREVGRIEAGRGVDLGYARA